jgi:hypothetical protein
VFISYVKHIYMENVIFTKFSSQKLVHVHHSIFLSHEIYYFRNVSPSHGMDDTSLGNQLLKRKFG